MRTEITKRNLYLFSELTGTAQAAAIDTYHRINVMDEYWYGSTLEEAKDLGFEIQNFDTGRGSSISIKLSGSPKAICERITKNHGKACDTYKLAMDYLESTDERDEEEFIKVLGEEYLSMLRAEYEYQTSEEAIREALEANEYEFTEDGESA